MQADIRVMADTAWVGIAEARWNMGGASWMIPVTRQIGLASALELILWGDTRYDARRCYELGWCSASCRPSNCCPRRWSTPSGCCTWRPAPCATSSRRCIAATTWSRWSGAPTATPWEQNLAGMRDSLEGPRAFAEKRAPHFTDT